MQKARKLHGRREWKGLQVSVENRKGSWRHWHDPHSNRSGSTFMRHAYGYLRRTEGADGEHLDVYLGPDLDGAPEVYIVRQTKAPDFKVYDEDKVMLGFASLPAARRAYLDQYDDPRFLGSIRAVPTERFVAAVHRADGGRVLVKSGGPYIGPKGGKWADAKHTVHWTGAVPYTSPSERKLTPDEEHVRKVAYELATPGASQGAVAEAVEAMAPHVPPGAVLVPVPDSHGVRAANLRLCRALAGKTGAKVEDVLRREAPVESSRARRKEGKSGLAVEEHKITRQGFLSQAENVILVDNVVTSGNTFEASRKALFGIGRGLAYAYANEVLKQAPKEKGDKYLYHTTAHASMGEVAEQGLKPRGEHSGKTVHNHGGYDGHSQGKLFLSATKDAADTWHDKVQDQLFDASDNVRRHVPVMLRVKKRATARDPVGDDDVPGTRYTKTAIPAHDLEFWHPKHQDWRPAAEWGQDTDVEHGLEGEGEDRMAVRDGGFRPGRRLLKAFEGKGQPKPNHKYISRKPDGKGGWIYTYAPSVNPKQPALDFDKPAPTPSGPNYHVAFNHLYERMLDRGFTDMMDVKDRVSRDILDAITLFTNGHVAAVRDPRKYDPDKAHNVVLGAFLRPSKGKSGIVRRWRVPRPSKDDYGKAHKVMATLAKAPINVDPSPPLYRGYALPADKADALQVGQIIDLSPIASFSVDRSLARNFARDTHVKKAGVTAEERAKATSGTEAMERVLEKTRAFKAVLFVLYDVKRGTRLGPVTAYQEEEEFVTGGKFKIEQVRGTEQAVVVTLSQPDLHKAVEVPIADDVHAAVQEAFDAPHSARQSSKPRVSAADLLHDPDVLVPWHAAMRGELGGEELADLLGIRAGPGRVAVALEAMRQAALEHPEHVPQRPVRKAWGFSAFAGPLKALTGAAIRGTL